MSKIRPLTQADVWDHIIGAHGLSWDWWSECRGTDGWDYQGDAPDGWGMAVKLDNPNADGRLSFTLDARVIMRAIRKIANKGVDGPSHAQPSDACVRECRALIFKGDADFDAATADEVLQVAVLGRIVY
ncbi:hypothetical protein OG401_23980 [Kitasatospora purpeofusca]|uniref:hypothetical protein n=1 Tax=Kitasatospora purpeofusca TaxID=67352 RepID=UPI00225A6F8A|nr:hypothetical protein [Kitasatospora purpeofusca]MCX4687324.1 hypothetical protein [Kitasatospora purpeofusca]